MDASKSQYTLIDQINWIKKVIQSSNENHYSTLKRLIDNFILRLYQDPDMEWHDIQQISKEFNSLLAEKNLTK